MPNLVPYTPPPVPARQTDDLFLRPEASAIILMGKRYVCASRITGKVGYNFVDPMVPGVTVSFTNAELWSWHRSGDLVFDNRKDFDGAVADHDVMMRSLASIDDRERANLDRRLPHCLAIDKSLADKPRKGEVWQPVCDAVAEANGHAKQHWKTIYQWWSAWVRSGRDPRALIGRERDRGPDKRQLNDIQLRALDAAADEWLRKGQPSFATAQHAANSIVVNALGGKQVVDALIKGGENPLIGYKTVRLHLEKLGRTRRLYHRNGADAARAGMTPTYQQPQPRLPLERVEADFKYLGLFVIDDGTKLPLGTPYVGNAIDRFSGCSAGSHLGFQPPGSAAAAHLLANVILPKTFEHCTDAHGNCAVDGDNPVNGVPRGFVLDNDSAFHAKQWQTSAQALGCDVTFVEPATPRKKGAIESFWKALAHSYTDMFPGKRLRIYKKPPRDYDPTKDAVIKLSALRTIITKAEVDVHNQGVDERSGQVRVERYREAARIHPPKPVPAHSDIVELIGCPATRSATRKGIRIHGMFYNSDELARYRDGFRTDPNVDVRFTHDDIGTILVIDKAKGLAIRVPCTLFEYADGLTLHQHRVIRAHAAHMGVNGRVKRHQLLLAKAQLYKVGKELLEKPTSRKHLQRLAHFFGMSPEKNQAVRATRVDHRAPDSILDSAPRDPDDDDITEIDPDIDGSPDVAEAAAAVAEQAMRMAERPDSPPMTPASAFDADRVIEPDVDPPRRKRGRPKGSGKRAATGAASTDASALVRKDDASDQPADMFVYFEPDPVAPPRKPAATGEAPIEANAPAPADDPGRAGDPSGTNADRATPAPHDGTPPVDRAPATEAAAEAREPTPPAKADDKKQPGVRRVEIDWDEE